MTAECMAEYARKPLIHLSVGDLVAFEDSIEERLTDAFKTAARLGAILLLDEADVVLEARSFEDVRRNGIVSGLWMSSAMEMLDDINIRNSFLAPIGIL